MNISKLAKHYHISIRTIRYYEEKGLIDSYRNSRNIREFTQENIKRLELILFFRGLDFPINEINAILRNMDYPFISSCFEKRMHMIEEKINTLINAQQILQSVMMVLNKHKADPSYSVNDFIKEQIYFKEENERLVNHMQNTNNIVLEIGENLIPLATEKDKSLLLQSIKSMRMAIEDKTNHSISLIRVKDNMKDLNQYDYRILKENQLLTENSFCSDTTEQTMVTCMTRDLKTIILSHLY